eukprot:UN07016
MNVHDFLLILVFRFHQIIINVSHDSSYRYQVSHHCFLSSM